MPMYGNSVFGHNFTNFNEIVYEKSMKSGRNHHNGAEGLGASEVI